MKKLYVLSLVTILSTLSFAQLPVSHNLSKKKALIEEFTGNTCGYCPDGHKIADQIITSLPGKAFAINIHTSTYATPATNSSASLDFRTPDGAALQWMPNVQVGSFPGGLINRRTPTTGYPQGTGGLAMSRSFWSGNVNTIITENTYVNIAGQAFLNPTTRQLVVNMEAYYTSNAPVNSNSISIDLIQNNIIAYQANGSFYYPAMIQTAGNDDTYKHNHALRDVITSGSFGEVITSSLTSGTLWSKTYNYTVNATYPSSGSKTIPAILTDLEIIAFITETDTNVMAVCKVPITITTSTDIFNPSNATDLVSFVNVYPSPMINEGTLVYTLNEAAPVTVEIVNALGQTVLSDDLKTVTAGEHKYSVDATSLSNGVYFVNLKVDNNTITKKITVLK